MVTPFRLKSTLGRSYNVDLNDSRRTKKALKQIGYFEMPEYGLTDYPDEFLFKGIENFQRDKGLRRDGIMKPEGETATALGKEVGEHDRRHNAANQNQARSQKTRSAFGLFDEIGQQRSNQSRDVISAKKALAWTGHFPRNRSKANDGRAGNDLFNAVRRFQKAAGIKVDGWMRPYGETERALDRHLELKLRDAKKTGNDEPEGAKERNQEQAAAAAIPPIVHKIAEFFGMAVMAAWTWWQTMSSVEREKVRRQVEGNGSGDNSEADCDHLHYNVDIPVCNGISRSRGKQAAAKCFASANERYAACRRGVPIDQLPPLDTWNN